MGGRFVLRKAWVGKIVGREPERPLGEMERRLHARRHRALADLDSINPSTAMKVIEGAIDRERRRATPAGWRR
jgi:hypothetical protein